MSWLLDTVVVSELRTNPNDGVADWIANEDPLDLYVSAVTIFELELGVQRTERRDSRQGVALRKWLERSVKPAFANRVLSFDAPAAVASAGLHVPDPRPERDAMIAGIALSQKMGLVTRNTKDFVNTGVACVNPWAGEA